MAKKKKKKKNNNKISDKQITIITENDVKQSSDISEDAAKTDTQLEDVLQDTSPNVPETASEEIPAVIKEETEESIKIEEIRNSESVVSQKTDEPTAEEHNNELIVSEDPVNKKEAFLSNLKNLPNKLKDIYGNKENVLPAFLISIIAFTVAFLLLLLPLIKRSSAINEMKEGRNEQALTELSGVVPLFGINTLKKEAQTNIIMNLAEELQKTNPKFSADHFKIESINNNSVDLSNDFEVVDFSVIYSNKDVSATLDCIAERRFDGNEWKTDSLEIVGTDYLINNECDESVSKETVLQKYPDALFVKKGEKEQLHQSFIYSFKSIDEDDPFKYANNEVDVLCTYNLANSKWVVAEMQKTVVSTEDIPFKEFSTSIFKIMLPEAWIMKMYEYYHENDYNDEHHISYNYNYYWFANKEDMMSYSEKDGGSSLFQIRISGNNYGNSYYYGNSNNSVSVSSNVLGKGKMTESSFNGTNLCSMTFNPKIKGISSYFDISSEYADSDKLLEIINQLKIRNSTYSIEVLVNELRIRSYASTSSQIVGHVRKGQKYKATEASDDYQGYRWFKIGDNQWIADLDGEYLSVKYN